MINHESRIQELYCNIYALEMLKIRGIDVNLAVETSLRYLLELLKNSPDMRLLDVAFMQIRAVNEIEKLSPEVMALSKQICECAGISSEDILKKELYLAHEVRLNRSQVRRMIRKWMPSRKNPMTIGEVTDDILDKVENNREGEYYYSYCAGNAKYKDIYKLVVHNPDSYFIDIKNFQIYRFIIDS